MCWEVVVCVLSSVAAVVGDGLVPRNCRPLPAYRSDRRWDARKDYVGHGCCFAAWKLADRPGTEALSFKVSKELWVAAGKLCAGSCRLSTVVVK